MSTTHHQQPPRALRSNRVAANTARPLQPSNLGAAPNSSQSHHSSGPSSLSLFLTNLRLLDLDLLPDWPGISPETFAATGTASAQGQKKRIQCVEWALFRLFALWDPEETANKLKPFFPPLDQVQSLNLRAALLRSLEQAKKNGVLGRDALLRKTMLDECKGERLEEVLAVFSSAVLKKVILDDTTASGLHPALALTLALENRGYKDDKTQLGTLVIAHKVSLHRMQERRRAVRARFQDFADLLSVKERGIARRREEVRAREQQDGAGKKTVSENARLEMRRTVRNNWTGDERWMETLLTGDSASNEAGPFGMPFDRVWRRVQQDRLSELEDQNTGLLDQLEGRVRMHKERLDKWHAYRQNLFGKSAANAAPSPSKKAPTRATRGIDLGLGAHEDVRIGRMSPRKLPSNAGMRMNRDYRDMLNNLKNELADADKPKTDMLSLLQNYRQQPQGNLTVPEQDDDEAISELSDLEEDETDNFTTGAPIRSFSAKVEGLKRLPARPNLSRPNTTPSDPWRSPSKADQTIRDQDIEFHPRQPASPPSQSPSPQRRGPTPGQSPTRHPKPDDQAQASPTQELADQILASMNSASPSPTKRPKPRHTLSLADRTRLSMVPRGSSLFLEDDEPELESTTTITTTIPLNDNDSKTLAGEDQEDLVSRTRRSMAGFEKARQKAQLERRRSQRRSKLPPRKEGSYFPTVDEDGGGVLTEELMQEEDMEAVFRSRPKIKASPLPSPTREMEFED